MLILRRLLIAGLAALAGIGGAAALAIAGGASGTTVTTVGAGPSKAQVAPPAAPKLARVPSWVRNEFGLFRGSAKVGAPAGAVDPSTVARFGLNLGIARQVPSKGAPLYALPGSKGICLDAGPVTGCGNRDQVVRRGILALYSCVAGAGEATQLFALVPDAVDRMDITLADGNVVEARPTHNLVAIATSTAPVHVAWRGSRSEATAIDNAGGC